MRHREAQHQRQLESRVAAQSVELTHARDVAVTQMLEERAGAVAEEVGLGTGAMACGRRWRPT